jgi:DNA-binding NarL/FixJ family response regulator
MTSLQAITDRSPRPAAPAPDTSAATVAVAATRTFVGPSGDAVARERHALLITRYGLAIAGLRETLRTDHGIVSVDAPDTIAAAVASMRGRTPALVVVGAECLLPNPASALQALRDASPGCRIAALAHQAQRTWTPTLIEHGVVAVIFHESTHADIARGLRDAINGEVHLDPRAQAELLRNLSGTPVRRPAITPRELEVLRLVARGLSNKAVGRELNLSEGAVKTYVRRLRQRLGARNRTDAAIHAISLGLLDGSRD